MNNTLKKVTVLAITLMLIGCTTPPVEPVKEVVYKTRIVLLDPPSALLTRTKMVPPPNKTEYLAMSAQERENAWTDIYILQNKAIATCNRNISDTSIWVDKQKELYKDSVGTN